MKRIVKLSFIILLVIICLTGIVHAKSSCNINIETSKSEFARGEEFTVDVKISNIQSERGFIALEAILEYTKDSLTLVRMQGQNEWSTPVKDLSYNEAIGKFAIDKNGLAKSDEVILKLTFKVNENSQKNVKVGLKNIKASDATVSTVIDEVYKNITIKEGTDNPIPTPPVDEPTNPSNPTEPSNPSTPTEPTNPSNPTKPSNPSTPTEPSNPSNPTGPSNPSNPSTPTITTNTIQTNTTNNGMANGKLPQTGNDGRLLMLFTAVAIITGLVLYIKMKIVNKQMGN